ncbi:MAG: TetR/AcrR family transcriptional regulator [Pseudomonadota bacterium]
MDKNTQLSEIKRQKIVEAAIAEFLENGFLGANTTRIAKRAEVSSRTLYKHFGSKEVLFDEIAQIMVERNNAMASVAFDPNRGLDEQLIEALKTYVEVVTDEHTLGLSRIINSELLRDLDRAKTLYLETAAHDYPITKLLGDAMDAGVLRKSNAEFAATQLLGLIKTFYFWPEYMIGQSLSPDGAMEDCVKMFLKHYEV